MKIVLTGGGTGGSVAPLLAIAEKIKKIKPETDFLFIGTRKGNPEKEMIKNYHFQFKGIFSGKFRRYFSWQNFLDPFLIFLGFIQSIFILIKFKPKIIISAGGFVAVPVSLAGWFLKIPFFIHQQDIVLSLTNKILAPFAKKITVSFKPSLKNFPKNKTVFTGQPIREMIFHGDKSRAQELFKLKKDKPVLLIIGGGTGALSLNQLIWDNLLELTKFCQIIHLAGKGKLQIENCKLKIEDYHPYEFINKEIADAYAIADLVISRAGINVLSELAVLGKPIIIIPISNSHQEANANYFQEKNAAIVLNQKELTNEKFVNIIKELINNKNRRKELEKNIKELISPDGCQKIIEEIFKRLAIKDR